MNDRATAIAETMADIGAIEAEPGVTRARASPWPAVHWMSLIRSPAARARRSSVVASGARRRWANAT